MDFKIWGKKPKTPNQMTEGDHNRAPHQQEDRPAANEALHEVRNNIAQSRREHGSYRSWLYRTKAWNVSFEDWKAARHVFLEVSPS